MNSGYTKILTRSSFAAAALAAAGGAYGLKRMKEVMA
jgi:hypothetical protein